MNAYSDEIYGSYNARFIAPRIVAQTFIPSDNYARLIDLDHSLVIGPRGSGKTSLLKMLQLDALRNWQHERAEFFRNKLTFTGIFIPTDIIWKEQLDACVSFFEDSPVGGAIVRSIITNNILLSITESFDSRLSLTDAPSGTFGYLDRTSDQKRVLCHALGILWEIEPAAPTFASLRVALRDRLIKITKFVEEMRLLRPLDIETQFVRRGLVCADYIELAANGIRTFNDILECPGERWAMCFDELELAPKFLRDRLLLLLRSTGQEIYFKLSMSPYSSKIGDDDSDNTTATEGDDYQVIPLWYPEKEDSQNFSSDVAKSLLSRSGIGDVDLEKFFGRSLVGSDSTVHTLSSPRGDRYEQMKELADKDPSFRRYLADNNISIERIPKLREPERAEHVRKIYPVVVHRNFFLKDRQWEKGQRFASRKSKSVYTGWQAIQAMCEGNPRILIGLLNDMLKSCNPNAARIPSGVQWWAIEAARGRLQAKLMAIKVTQSGYDKGLMRLIDILGGCFKRDLLGEDFKAEPVASFDLDSDSFEWLENAVGAGLNAGALIYLPADRSKTFIKTLAGKRFRVNYLLATEFQIPLRKGGHRSVSFLIRKNDLENQILIKFA